MKALEADSRINKVVLFIMGDAYHAAKIVGTTQDYLEGKPLADGEMFAEKIRQ